MHPALFGGPAIGFDEGSALDHAMRTAARLALGFLMALATCGAGGPTLPPDAAIFPEAIADDLLRQCSRAVPPAYDGHWLPTAADIAALETALPRALDAARPTDVRLRAAPQGWRRQYGGFLRGGRRFIYGNFLPRASEDNFPGYDWKHVAPMVCDGGQAFFGVEYDVEARRFTHLGFNGDG